MIQSPSFCSEAVESIALVANRIWSLSKVLNLYFPPYKTFPRVNQLKQASTTTAAATGTVKGQKGTEQGFVGNVVLDWVVSQQAVR